MRDRVLVCFFLEEGMEVKDRECMGPEGEDCEGVEGEAETAEGEEEEEEQEEKWEGDEE